jgi:hypothetical protein
MNKKGQLSFINIFSWIILLILGVIFTPMINSFISDTINNTANLSTMTLLIMRSILPMFWLGIVITFFLYVAPIQPRQYQ